MRIATIAILAGATAALAQPVDVQTFARALYVEGVPLAEARAYDPAAALDPLLAMLADPAEEEHWANVVVILGMLGDDRALDAMLDVVERADGEVSDARWRAAKAVPMALGYLVHFGHSERALRYLLGSLDPDAWRARGLGWRSRIDRDLDARDARLARMAVLGLALSGEPRAGAALRAADPARLAGRSASPDQVARMSALVDRTLEEHGKIAARGLRCYYDPRCVR